LFGVEADQDRDVVEAVVPVTLGEPGAVGAVATKTIVVAVEVPFAFVAVSVYRVVVDRAGVVVLVPVTVPILGLMDREVALATVQLSVDVPFKATTVGEAVNEEMVGGELEEASCPCHKSLGVPSFQPMSILSFTSMVMAVPAPEVRKFGDAPLELNTVHASPTGS
jgi:hypothetical protein